MSDTTKAIAGKFNSDNDAEVRIKGIIIGILTRDYVTCTTGTECLGDYSFEPISGTDEDSELWDVMHVGYRVQSAASARKKILADITAKAV